MQGRPKRKRNLLAERGVSEVDYKDVELLRKFISDRGKIRARRVTGLTPKQQNQVATAIKNAREMALLPYPGPARG
ncbi:MULTISPECIES: 30S ribosomal protein S18 [Sciscionella]|uniref:30S ribosomal protein S18 n=1 Tax=Sciscionella TaxID=596495 RepID=UPI00035D083D|nr:MULTISPECIES: 30S ribosomal protein S18 [Sciscionella]